MALNRKCPKCGSEKVQLSNIRSKQGCLWYIIFGFWFIIWRLIKLVIGLTLLVCLDWWMAIIKAATKKGYVWQSMKWISGTKKNYYCHECGYNFSA